MNPRLEAASRACLAAFNPPIPAPLGISDEYLASVLEQAFSEGLPVPADFDGWCPVAWPGRASQARPRKRNALSRRKPCSVAASTPVAVRVATGSGSPSVNG